MNDKKSTMFFKFSSDESKDSIVKRLQEVKQIGIGSIIASYSTQGMQQAKFDDVYFSALDRLTRACRENGIRFWLEDYAPFPTGSANGAYKEPEYADLNKLFIDERHVDVSGPLEAAVIRIDELEKVVYGKSMHRFSRVDLSCRKRIGVVACRMKENPECAASPLLEEETAVILDGQVEKGFLKWDVPKGYWRIFVIYTTCESSGRPGYMNLLSKASVALEIEMVHKPIYEHLKEELGKNWIGFFYDEPETGNAGGEAVFDFFMLPGRRSQQQTDCNVFSWSPEMPAEMDKREPDWIKRLPCLWYNGTGEIYRDFRCRYMDAVSSLVRENYNGQVYEFCRERGIRYIGHVLEDENCHTRLGCGPSHYFRQQYFQDEAGIDVIAGQILPGKDRLTSWYGVVNSDGEFYHYGLAKLASSEAHINPLKKNRAAAECFAMYGQQGLAERKFLLDHLMVNGVNHMLLAELPAYEASWEYSKALVEYTDRLCSLLQERKPVIKTAILYHAYNEWREGEMAQKFQKPGAQLARNQISYDVVPADAFTYPDRYNTKTDKGLTINGNIYEALIIPACGKLPKAVEEFVRNSRNTGYPVFFADRLPQGFEEICDGGSVCCIPLTELAQRVKEVIKPDILVEAKGKEWIRYSHLQQGEEHHFLLHNEAPFGETQCQVTVAAESEILVWDVMADRLFLPRQEKLADGQVRVFLHLGQYEMKVLYISGREHKKNDVFEIKKEQNHTEKWEAQLPDGSKIYGEKENLPKPEEYVGYDFYGKLIYRTSFYGDGELPAFLELGKVSDCCEVFINGRSAGKCCGAPYIYDVGKLMVQGRNEVAAQVYTSASNMKNPRSIFGIPMDALTAVPYSLVEAMGITGPVKWLF